MITTIITFSLKSNCEGTLVKFMVGVTFSGAKGSTPVDFTWQLATSYSILAFHMAKTHAKKKWTRISNIIQQIVAELSEAKTAHHFVYCELLSESSSPMHKI